MVNGGVKSQARANPTQDPKQPHLGYQHHQRSETVQFASEYHHTKNELASLFIVLPMILDLLKWRLPAPLPGIVIKSTHPGTPEGTSYRASEALIPQTPSALLVCGGGLF